MKMIVFLAATLFSLPSFAQPTLVRPGFAPSHCRKPLWPPRDMELGHEGGVQVAVMVGADGKVIKTAIQLSSGFPNLDEAAEAGLKNCIFKPGTVNQQPVAMWKSVYYSWIASENGVLGGEWRKILRLAEEGNAAALYAFAKYQLGVEETRQNGIEMLKLVANAGFPMAEYELAQRYEEGCCVERDQEAAEQWYAKALSHGDPLARERARLLQGATKSAQ